MPQLHLVVERTEIACDLPKDVMPSIIEFAITVHRAGNCSERAFKYATYKCLDTGIAAVAFSQLYSEIDIRNIVFTRGRLMRYEPSLISLMG